MPTQGLDIGLQIRNNTNYPQQINVMGNPTNLLDTANATTEYRYDLTGFTITYENFVSILPHFKAKKHLFLAISSCLNSPIHPKVFGLPTTVRKQYLF